MKNKNELYKEPDFDEVLIETEDDEFEIGQCYEKIPAKNLNVRVVVVIN